eukprot:gene32036-40485_t
MQSSSPVISKELQSLGIDGVFNPGNDSTVLHGMSEDPGLMMEGVYHQVLLTVPAAGRAATSAMGGGENK